MRYVFRHFPSNFNLKILAASTQEDSAIARDAREYKARLLVFPVHNTLAFTKMIFQELLRHDYDIILSQGFTSAAAVYIANMAFQIPHILTIHGILESRYLDGRFAFLKRFLFGRMLQGISVLYGVSNDIIAHVLERFPKLRYRATRTVVIPNGIDPLLFDSAPAAEPLNLRSALQPLKNTFLFGFLGRFMPEKGFDLLIDAVDCLRKRNDIPSSFAVVAVGSGDYIRELRKVIHGLELERYFHFLPLQPDIQHLLPQFDAVVMPSRWEAIPLLAMETLCTGTPLIASDCIGLREAVRGTPALIFPSEDVRALTRTMHQCLLSDNLRQDFEQYKQRARARYDVANSARALVEVID
jgi:glycosyltransferase involved in cell wall biosynthesis